LLNFIKSKKQYNNSILRILITVVLVFAYLYLSLNNFDYQFIIGILILYIFGDALYSILKFPQSPLLLNIFVKFSISLIVFTILTVIITLVYQYNTVTLPIIVLVLTLVSVIYSEIVFNNKQTKTNKNNSKIKLSLIINIGIILFIIIVPLLLMLYTRSGASYPTFPGKDHFNYHVWENKLLEENGYNGLFLESKGGPKITLAQPISYYAMIGQLDIFLNTRFIDFHYYAPFFTLTWYSVLLFYYSITFFKKRLLAILAVLFGTTIVGSGHFYGPHDFYSTSVTLLLSLTFILVFLRNSNKYIDKRFIVFSLLAYLTIFFMYPFTAAMIFPFVTYFFIKRNKIPKYLLIAPVVILVLLLLYFQGSFLRFKEWDFIYQSKIRLNLVYHSYSLFHIYTILFGIILLLFKSVRKKINQAHESGIYFFIVSITILAIFWLSLPDGITIRLEWYFRTFLVMISIIPLFILLSLSKQKIKTFIFYLIILSIIIATLFMSEWNILGPTIKLNKYQETLGGAISGEEYKLLDLIKANTNKNDYIIGEPYFCSIIRGAIDRFCSSAIIRPSGESPSSTGKSVKELKNINFEFFSGMIDIIDRSWIKKDLKVSTTTEINFTDKKYDITNLIDRKDDTLAYLGSRNNEFVITFPNKVELSEMEINWGEYGLPYGKDGKTYFDKWEIQGNTDGSWISIANGSTPQSDKTSIEFYGKFSAIKIITKGREWHGIYEVKIRQLPKIFDQNKLLNDIKNSLSDLNLNRKINDLYVLITPRTLYWQQENNLNCEGQSCTLSNKLGVWPIKASGVQYRRSEILTVLKSSGWEILYNKEGFIFAKYIIDN